MALLLLADVVNIINRCCSRHINGKRISQFRNVEHIQAAKRRNRSKWLMIDQRLYEVLLLWTEALMHAHGLARGFPW